MCIRDSIWIQTTRPESTKHTKALVDAWYKERAKVKLGERILECQKRFPKTDKVEPRGFTVRAMKQRWGSMTPTGQLILNRRLVEAPVDAIDYVITHELCHMQEPNHSNAFFDYLSEVMPDWRNRKAHLERTLA